MATDDHMKIDALGLPPGAEMMNFGRFDLENGFHIDEVTVGYTTYGTLNEVHVRSPHNARSTPAGSATASTPSSAACASGSRNLAAPAWASRSTP